jgi:hypothetical protein
VLCASKYQTFDMQICFAQDVIEMNELTISDRPLKEFLRIFDKNERLEIIEIGDTRHPLSGFVDQTYFRHIKTVDDLLKADYDFEGLVIFIAKIKGVLIDYHGDYYKIIGDKKEIEKLKFNSPFGLV